MADHNLLLYGANGYTGKLITRFAADYDLQPILAGRTEAKIQPLAEKHNLPYRIFDLNDTAALQQALSDVEVVLHAAGPFMHTARPMMEACLATQTHYLDITGEIPVFEMGNAFSAKAKAANIMLMPGTGFDVVPTDCLASYLNSQLPDATHLKLAFTSIGSGVSHGTALTMAENLGEGGAVRQDGKITRVPMGHKGMWIDFGVKKRYVMTIPWGDVSTAYYSTGIPNIETYMGIAPSTHRWVKLQKYFNWLLRTDFVRNLAKKRIEKQPAGPSDEQRKNANSLVWGEVRNAHGAIRQARLITPDGYTLTAHSSLMIAKKVLKGNAPTGFQTPSRAYGADLVLEVPNAKREDVFLS